ncbi:hypothetical protein GCM10007392_10930 [Saccharospirillum salsuginis]|uniref:Uncharacterized protein n=1 Tax=Saccharospirillum salsuginis TaxID=418750 RepID=A0A918K3S1_9GAMM|nr:hypothetical protein GCM10007392_10930 [Saccharospirillum salsuginis]
MISSLSSSDRDMVGSGYNAGVMLLCVSGFGKVLVCARGSLIGIVPGSAPGGGGGLQGSP